MRASNDSRESALSSFAKGSLRNSPFHILYNVIRTWEPMLEFNLHEIRVGSRFYIFLPKLNRTQMQVLGIRLKRLGYILGGDPSITARNKGFVLHIDRSSLCWSTSDPADSVVPAIPELLATPK